MPSRKFRLRRTPLIGFVTVALAGAGLTAAAAHPVANPQHGQGKRSHHGAGWSPRHRRGRAPGLKKQTLASYGSGGYPQYRIPAMAVTNKGTLLAGFDGRPTMADLPSNITSLVRRSTNGGRSWKPVKVARSAPKPKGFGDPSFIVDHTTGRIFMFHAASVNQGFAGSHTGNDPSDPNILQTDYNYSDDDGRTWHSRRITPQIKDPSWNGIFAASGEGIQINSGKYKGRLVQQYVIEIHGGEYTASAYSDDHGKNWTMDTPVGPGMNESKVVQLADDTLMLNVRAAPHRLVAYSHDGGQTWSKPKPDPQQTDPSDNGSIIRYAPKAKPSNPKSHWLLLSNNDDPSLRRNLTVKMSCDDGKTWPISRVVDPGSAGYSTMTKLPSGKIGLFYESHGYRHMTYTSFGLKWLNGLCAPLTVAKPDTVTAGEHGKLEVTVTNQSEKTIRGRTVTAEAPKGWHVGKATVSRLGPGAKKTVSVPFRAPRTAAADTKLTVLFGKARPPIRFGGERHRHSSVEVTVPVKHPSNAPHAPKLSGRANLDGMTAGGAAGSLDDIASYVMRVRNAGNTKLTDVTVTGNMDNLARCHYSALKPGQDYTCPYASHAITEKDVAAGHYRPKLTITAKAPDGRRVKTTINGETVAAPRWHRR